MRLAVGSLAAFLLLICSSFAGLAQAHELQPSSMELRQLTSERFEVIWRAPVYYRKPHPARLQFPETWQPVGEPSVKQLPDAALHRHVVDVPDGAIDGAVIRFVGLESTITDVFVRVSRLDGSESSQVVRPTKPYAELRGARPWTTTAGEYLVLGFQHILLSHRAALVLEFHWPRRAELVPAYLIGSLGAYWTIQRTVMML